MMLTPQDALIRIARSYSWVRERGGQNRGEAVEYLLRLVGLEPGQPWCAAFVAKVGVSLLGDAWPLPMVGGCMSLYEAAHAKGLTVREPSPSSIFLLWLPVKDKAGRVLHRFAHTGLCIERLPNGNWLTIEGNTAGDGRRDGWGVFERKEGRAFGTPDQFIEWWRGMP